MTVGELIITNKDKYNKVFIIENDNENKAVFTRVLDENISEEVIDKLAKDYFLLDIEAISEIFGNSDQLGINEQDIVLFIGI